MAESQVILCGSHLGGSLAAWTQVKYPKLVTGVWATGAPFLANDFLPGFLNSIRHFVDDAGGEKCLKALDDTFMMMKREMEDVNPPDYVDIYQMCPGFDFNNHYDQATLLYRLTSAISRSVLWNDPRDISENLCYELLDVQYLDVVEAFAPYFLDRRRPRFRRGYCLDYSFKHLLNDTANRDGAVDAWAYQSCYEYGWFAGGPEHFWMAPTFFQALCYNAFSLLGEEREEAQEETQRLMSSIENDDSGNILLSYGLLDPWTRAGINRIVAGNRGVSERLLMFVKGKLASLLKS